MMKTSIIPKPNKIEVSKGFCKINPTNTVSYSNECSAGDYLRDITGLRRAEKGDIQLSIDSSVSNDEGYVLNISTEGIYIKARCDAGLFYGVQTLRQLLPPSIEREKIKEEVKLPNLNIEDDPLFSYRGFMFDSVRHFFPVDVILHLIDLMALHKLNRFHWHLTDDQGFRIEIDKFPKLASVSSARKESQFKGFILPWTKKYDGTPHFGIYTKDEIRQVVEYARTRHIEVIPEIDMPGHFVAALAAYPEYSCSGGPFEVRTGWGISKDVLCVGKPQAIQFAKDILSEVIELFPYKHIHIGGDETPTGRWKKCPDCQKLMRKNGFKHESWLQRYFTEEIVTFLKSKGCSVIGWDEVLKDGVIPEMIVQKWSIGGEKRIVESIRSGQKCIISNVTKYYLDYPFSVFPLKRTYNFNPHLAGLSDEEAKNIIGVEAPLWTEAVDTIERIHWQMFPRLTAVSESGWTKNDEKNFDDFLLRLDEIEKRYEVLDVFGASKESYKYDGRAKILKILFSKDHAAVIDYKKYKNQ